MSYISNSHALYVRNDVPILTDGGRLSRRYADERSRWAWAAAAMRGGAYPNDPQFTSRPYLIAHPEREIAAADSHRVGVAHCAACRETFIAPHWNNSDLGLRIARAYTWMRMHNALIHPRRAARLTQ